MARPGRPVSETYQQVSYSGSQSISFSSEAETVGREDEDDHAPIFSLSKSSMDVVMATGPTHKRDPVWTRTDLRRSSSTNTHSEQNSGTLKQLHPHMWQHIGATNSHQLPLTAQNTDVHSPPALSDRWIVNMQRWSQCSGSTQSRSSTPDTIVWKDRTSRPSSLTQEPPFSAAVESTTSKPVSPTTTRSPFNSPQHTPTLPPEDVLISSSSSQLLTNTQQQKDLLVSSATSSPRLPSKQSHTPSPLPSNSPNLLHLTSTEDTDLSENNLFSFTFPSPIASSVNLAEEGASSHPGCLADDVLEELHSPGDTQITDSGEAEILSYLTAHSPTKGQESEASFCYLELPSQLGQSCLTGQGWRSPLVSSMSDSQLGNCCRCNLKTREGITWAPNVEVFREEGTMTSRLNLVDAAVQTISPLSSLWGLTRNMSSSNMGSHSILGSPPGSRLNLKSSVGSHSNLVSPSSSMFPVSSGEEDERKGDDQTWNSPTLHDLDRRRSCLKIQGEERDEMGRRSSMKQVQWDEDGMTWDIHGASVDPEVLCEAIQKHLDIQSSPQPAKRPSKKKKAPKPPLISNVVKAITPEINTPVMIMSSTCLVEGEPEETPAGDTEEEEKEGGKKEEIISRADEEKEENAKEEDEVCVEEGTGHPKSPSRGSAHSCKKSVIRSLRRPGWCGGSRKADD